MATVDERVAFREGRVNEQSQMINGIRDALVSLGSSVTTRPDRDIDASGHDLRGSILPRDLAQMRRSLRDHVVTKFKLTRHRRPISASVLR